MPPSPPFAVCIVPAERANLLSLARQGRPDRLAVSRVTQRNASTQSARDVTAMKRRDQPGQRPVKGTVVRDPYVTAAVTCRDRGRLEQEGTSEASVVYVCVLCSNLCLPLRGLAGGATTTRGTDPLLPRVGANVQRRRGVGSPPTGSAEAGGGRGATPRTSGGGRGPSARSSGC